MLGRHCHCHPIRDQANKDGYDDGYNETVKTLQRLGCSELFLAEALKKGI